MNFNRPVGTDSDLSKLPAVETAGYFQVPLRGNARAKGAIDNSPPF